MERLERLITKKGLQLNVTSYLTYTEHLPGKDDVGNCQQEDSHSAMSQDVAGLQQTMHMTKHPSQTLELEACVAWLMPVTRKFRCS